MIARSGFTSERPAPVQARHAKSVTVFVRKIGNHYLANTHASEAIHPTSPMRAVLAAAARFFGVPEEEIVLDQDSQHVTIAYLRAPAREASTLVALVLYTAGLFTGAIVFGEFLISAS